MTSDHTLTLDPAKLSRWARLNQLVAYGVSVNNMSDEDQITALRAARETGPIPMDELAKARGKQQGKTISTSQPVSGVSDTDELSALLAEMEASAGQPAFECETCDYTSDDVEDQHNHSTAPPLFIGMPDTMDYIFDGHAGAGPSGAERWMTCTGSLEMGRRFLETLSPNQQSQFSVASVAARQGTTAHAVGELEVEVMLGRVDQTEADNRLMELTIMPETEGEAYDAEMAAYITEYVDLARQYAEAGHEILLEARVEAGVPVDEAVSPEGVYVIRGSADLIALPTEDENVLTVGDLKYGDGIDVDVDSNPQVRIYALGVLGLLADEEGNLPYLDKIVYHIIQPRLGGIKTWEESLDDLLDWRDDVLSPALSLALAGAAGGATLTPSEKACQWCPARGGCPALTEQRMSSAADLFSVITETEFETGILGAFPETGSLSDERIGALLSQIKGLTDIEADLKAEVQRRLHRGNTIPGWQMVNYQPPRVWKDGAAEALADEDVWKPQVLVTPTQALKIMGEDSAVLADLIDKPAVRPVAAPDGDRRKTWSGTPPEQMFPDLPDEDGDKA